LQRISEFPAGSGKIVFMIFLHGKSLREFFLLLLMLGVLMFGSLADASVRPPAVAGSFYPGDPATLESTVKQLLGEKPTADCEVPRAVVVPHAGYIYSGETAAVAFRCFRGSGIHRIILLGPSHRMNFSGGALPEAGITAFALPTGTVELDLPVLKRLRGDTLFKGPAAAHRGEHSLEVQLPFLHEVLPEARIVPVLVGASTGTQELRDMAKTLLPLLDPQTAIVVSSDFTHYGRSYGWTPFPPGPDLRQRLHELCEKTALLIAGIRPEPFRRQVEISGDTVCGRDPIYVLLHLLSHAFTGQGRVLKLANSGDRTGDYSQAVSYASIAFAGTFHAWKNPTVLLPRDEFPPEIAKVVPLLARAVLETKLGHGPAMADFYLRFGEPGEFQWPAGAFVTLNHRGMKPGSPGRLRACMGLMDHRQSLQDAVIEAALSASEDPRFPPLKFEELSEISVEVSVLTPAKPVASPRDIVIGRDGVILSKHGRRAVFLPQVATEQGWDLETMLSHLSRKAGLSPDAWKHGAHFEVFQAHVFEEED